MCECKTGHADILSTEKTSGQESETRLEGGALFSECGCEAARRQQFGASLIDPHVPEGESW